MTEQSDGATANYYKLPMVAEDYFDLAAFKQMDGWREEIFFKLLYLGRVDSIRVPEGATELKHIISKYNMNFWVGDALCEIYRLGGPSHCPVPRGLRKIIACMEEEKVRLVTTDMVVPDEIHDIIVICRMELKKHD